ncbi:MAG TPA: histidine kinase [Longimicrobiaceae bacterium]|nr:histidine kinase [Longimicrobiaceae bacterium]
MEPADVARKPQGPALRPPDAIQMPWRLILLCSLVIWGVLTAPYAVEYMLEIRTSSGKTDWLGAALLAAMDMAGWAGVSLAILWVQVKAPVRRDGRLAPGLLHVGVGVAAMVLRQLVLLRVGSGHVDAGLLARILMQQALVVVLMLAAGYGLVAFVDFRQRQLNEARLAAQLAVAELGVLKEQVNPHFLFNTLHSISTLVHSDPDAAEWMIAALSEMLRASLLHSGVHEVPLTRELELLAPYLAIQRKRFGDRLTVDLAIGAETQAAIVPHLLLQPLVENAIRHGIESSAGGGSVTVRTVVDSRRLVLSVQDTGPGPGRSTRRGTGTSLANLRKRLEHLYGEDHSLTLATAPHGTGALVTVSVPFRQ